MQRADTLCKPVLAGTLTRFLHWNTKFVECPSAGEARIGCELSPCSKGASRNPPGDSVKSGRDLLVSEEGEDCQTTRYCSANA